MFYLFENDPTKCINYIQPTSALTDPNDSAHAQRSPSLLSHSHHVISPMKSRVLTTKKRWDCMLIPSMFCANIGGIEVLNILEYIKYMGFCANIVLEYWLVVYLPL